MMKKSLIIMIALMLCAPVLAKSIVLNAEETIVPFSVSNTSMESQPLGLEFFAPCRYEVNGMPSELAAGETADFEIVLKHDEDLIGDIYTGQVIMTIGADIMKEEFRLEFQELKAQEEQEETQEQTGETETTENQVADTNAIVGAATGFVSLLEFAPNTMELVLDVLLFIVVVILFIAFISRFIKRLEARS